MPRHGKKYNKILDRVDLFKRYSFIDALQLIRDNSYAKFDESLDIAVRLGVDPRHADQMVRGSVVLPNGLGKKVKVLVFAKGEKEIEAKEAGADFIGNDDLIESIKEGWYGFDKAVATPDMMGVVGKIGRLLGPRGLMPNPKTGSVTSDISKVVKELKSGKIDFKVDKTGIIHTSVGKVSFDYNKLIENIKSFLDVVIKLKPASSKGSYIKSIFLSSTMGPGIRVDLNLIAELMR